MVMPTVSQKEMDELINKKAHDKVLEAFSMLGYLTGIHGPNKLKDIIDTIVRANEYAYKMDEEKEYIPIFTYLIDRYGKEYVEKMTEEYSERNRGYKEQDLESRLLALEREIADLKKK